MCSIIENVSDKEPANSCFSVCKWERNLHFYILLLLVEGAGPHCIPLAARTLYLNTKCRYRATVVSANIIHRYEFRTRPPHLLRKTNRF
jgi:hypothetical protein